MEPGLTAQDRFRALRPHARREMADRTGPGSRSSAALLRQVRATLRIAAAAALAAGVDAESAAPGPDPRDNPSGAAAAALPRQGHALQGDLPEDGGRGVGGPRGCNRPVVLVPGSATGIGPMRGHGWFRAVTAHPGIGGCAAFGATELV